MLDSLSMPGISYLVSGLPYMSIKTGVGHVAAGKGQLGVLIVTSVIGVWYFAIVLGQPGDTPLFAPGMAVFAFILIVTAILTAIASGLALIGSVQIVRALPMPA